MVTFNPLRLGVSDRPLEEWEFPEEDEDGGDESETLACPACSEEIYEQADYCPYCGADVVPGMGTPLVGRPWWYVALAVLGIIATIVVLMRS